MAAHNGGRYPAIRGYDRYIGGLDAGNATTIRNQIINDWATDRVIPTVSQHWTPSVDHETGPGDEAIATPVPIDDCFAGDTTTYIRYQQWKQVLGDDLAALADSGVPVMFRPWHEAGGTWFWWSQEGPGQYVRLWRDLWDYLVNQREIHNLLWVWSAGLVGISTDWYPGDAYVDVSGHDRYDVPGGDYASHRADLLRYGSSNKVRAMTEVGYIPADPAAFARLPMAWAMTWTSPYITQNSDAALTAFYSNPAVITRANVRKFVAGAL